MSRLIDGLYYLISNFKAVSSRVVWWIACTPRKVVWKDLPLWIKTKPSFLLLSAVRFEAMTSWLKALLQILVQHIRHQSVIYCNVE